MPNHVKYKDKAVNYLLFTAFYIKIKSYGTDFHRKNTGL